MSFSADVKNELIKIEDMPSQVASVNTQNLFIARI